jgi:hypothetical protein
MEIQSGPIGSVGHEKVSIEGAKLVVEAQAQAAVAGGMVEVEDSLKIKVGLKAVYHPLLAKLAELIPGKFDDMLIAEGEAALDAWIASQG